MRGWRTLIFNLVCLIATAYIIGSMAQDPNITTDRIAAISAILLGFQSAGNVALRAITKTNIGRKD